MIFIILTRGDSFKFIRFTIRISFETALNILPVPTCTYNVWLHFRKFFLCFTTTRVNRGTTFIDNSVAHFHRMEHTLLYQIREPSFCFTTSGAISQCYQGASASEISNTTQWNIPVHSNWIQSTSTQNSLVRIEHFFNYINIFVTLFFDVRINNVCWQNRSSFWY